MSAETKASKLGKLRRLRNEAAGHLDDTIRQQAKTQAFLPSIGAAVVIELSDFIERINEQIDECEKDVPAAAQERYFQGAFQFLRDISIAEGEIPF